MIDVDGHNVIGAGWPGGSRPSSQLGIGAVFTSGGGTADDWLVARVRASGSPRELTVVSSDREVARKARNLWRVQNEPGSHLGAGRGQ